MPKHYLLAALALFFLSAPVALGQGADAPIDTVDVGLGGPGYRLVESPIANRVDSFLLAQRAYLVTTTLPRDKVYGRHFPVEGGLYIDTVWLKSADYYGTWKARDVAPYGYDGLKLEDSLHIALESDGAPWVSPLRPSETNSVFGLRRWRWHYGTDLDVEIGDTVYAVADGIIRICKVDRYGYGNYLMVRHKNGLETLYGHLSAWLVAYGDEVERGQPIGLAGNTGRSTGPHLHFEVRYKGVALDPETVYDFEKGCLHQPTVAIEPAAFAYLKEARAKRYHRVRRGDTLGRIAINNGVTIGYLCRMNGISRRSILRVGQMIRLK